MTVRHSSFSVDFVTAEVFAAPFWLMESLTGAVTTLSPRLNDRKAQFHATAQLFRATERYLLSQVPAMNLDEFVAIRDRCWFPVAFEEVTAENSSVSLQQIALALGDILKGIPGIGQSSSLSTASSDPQVSNRQRRFRELHYWFSTALPPDFLRAAIAVRTELQPDDRGLRLCNQLLFTGGISPNVQHVLMSRGFAETHMHLGAAFEFTDYWAALMLYAGRDSFCPDTMCSPGAEWDEGRELAGLSLTAAFLRTVIARFLRSVRLHTGESVSRAPSFVAFFETLLDELTRANRRSFCELTASVVRDTREGRFSLDPLTFRSLQSLYRSLLPHGFHNSVNSLRELHGRDPISGMLSDVSVLSHEDRLMADALHYLHRGSHTDEGDTVFAEVFWQYEKIRNTIYRHVVNRPMTPGLHWFVRHFDRLWPVKDVFSPAAKLESALSISGGHYGLRSLEVRTSPPETIPETLRLIQAVYDRSLKSSNGQSADRSFGARGASQSTSDSGNARATEDPDVEYGIVFHIVRNRGGGSLQGTPNANGIGTFADPVSGEPPQFGPAITSSPRFEPYYRRQMSGIRPLETVLRRYPLSLQVIRGFDACTDEPGIPTWLMVPLFERLRNAAAAAQTQLKQQIRHHVPLPGSTVHAGEDYVHILSGLRRIDEAIDFLNLGEGDRLGHALALGDDACQWCRNAGDVTMTVEDRLFDLVWEWSAHASLATNPGANRLHFLASSIAQLSGVMFGERVPSRFEAQLNQTQWPPDAARLHLLRSSLARPSTLEQFGFGRSQRQVTPDSISDVNDQILYSYLYDPDVFRRGRSTIVVNSRSYAETHGDLQMALRHKVEILNLAVEANPSSNLLIGDLAELQNHPLWRLNSPEIEGQFHAIPLTIGSDDPITFASTLPQEYQRLADALAAQGHSETATLDWIERVRETGMRYRFTIPRSHFRNLKLQDIRGTVPFD